jgi:YHS domain-containing protein
MCRLFRLVSWFICIAITTGLTVESAEVAQSEDPGFCIIRPDEPASAEIFADYRGERFYFCCESCRRDFLSDPSRFDGLAASSRPDSMSRPDSWNDDASPYSKTFWGRVGRVMLALAQVGQSINRHLHLDDALSRGLALATAASFVLVLGLWRRQKRRGLPLRPPVSVAIVAAFALVPLFYADRLRHRLADSQTLLAKTESERLRLEKQGQEFSDRDAIHYATFFNFGNPPIPRPSKLPPSLHKTYYRGNDERSDEMPHGGNYLTVTFDLWIEDADGRKIEVGSELVDANDQPKPLDLVVQFTRAPETSSGYFTDEYMKRMYVTMQSGEFLGRDQPVRDRASWEMLELNRVWRARFPLPTGVMVWETVETELHPQLVHQADSTRPHDRGGVVYLCEDRFDRGQLIGGRFHYAIQYDLKTNDGVVTSDSDLWMQATYRGRNFAQLQIDQGEWLSSDPIPARDADPQL